MPFRISILVLLLVLSSARPSPAPLMTRSAFVGFYSKTPLEDIRGENNQVYAILDPDKHQLAFAMLMRGFIFTKELMQEHFNENYVESDKFPKATFSGTCSGDMDLQTNGIYQVVVKGDITLHGVTQPVETTAQLDVKNDRITGTAAFDLKPESFQIKIPSIVRDKIAQQIHVRVQTVWTRSK